MRIVYKGRNITNIADDYIRGRVSDLFKDVEDVDLTGVVSGYLKDKLDLLLDSSELELIDVTSLKNVTTGTGSSGVLRKWEGKLDNRKVLIKLSSRGRAGNVKHESVIEVLCYELCKLLNIDCAEYRLVNVKYYDAVNLEELVEVGCIAEWFLGDDEEFISHYMLRRSFDKSMSEFANYRDHYPEALYGLTQMILLDFLIQNPDRHAKNFGFISKNGELKLAPIYDNGAGFLGDVSYAENEADYFEDYYGKSFVTGRRGNYESLNLAKDLLDRVVDTEYLFSDLLKDFSEVLKKYEAFLPPWKSVMIIRLLEDRLTKLRRLLYD